MKKVKFVHCSDIHLDMPFTSLGVDTHRSAQRRQDLKETFRGIVEFTKNEKADLLLICGDLYEHHYVKKSTLHFINDQFKQIPYTKILMVPGNHDPQVQGSYYTTFEWNENVVVLGNGKWDAVLEDLEVRVFGNGFKNFIEPWGQVDLLPPVDPEYINILLVHGTVDMNFKKNNYNPVRSQDLSLLGMDYVGVGHFHTMAQDIGGVGVIYNPGSPEPLGFDEPGEHGVFVGEISKTPGQECNLEVAFVPMGKRQYHTLEIPVEGCVTDEQVVEKVIGALKDYEVDRDLFSIILRGYLDPEYKISVPIVQSALKEHLFFVKVKDGTSVDYPLDDLIKEPGLKGVFIKKMLSLIYQASNEKEKELLTRALYYGLEALVDGKVRDESIGSPDV